MSPPPVLLPALAAALARTTRHEHARDLEREARFDLDELSGRLVELRGAAALTCAFGLIAEAQLRGEPAVYVCSTKASFYPPDAAEGGIDLDALVVVRAAELAARGRAADELVRSGAFALVVLEFDAASRGLSPALLSRLLGLAQKHATAIVFITSTQAEPTNHEEPPSSLGSLVSLRAVLRRAPLADGRYRLSLEVTKDKRRAPGWGHEERCRAPAGLR